MVWGKDAIESQREYARQTPKNNKYNNYYSAHLTRVAPDTCIFQVLQQQKVQILYSNRKKISCIAMQCPPGRAVSGSLSFSLRTRKNVRNKCVSIYRHKNTHLLNNTQTPTCKGVWGEKRPTASTPLRNEYLYP